MQKTFTSEQPKGQGNIFVYPAIKLAVGSATGAKESMDSVKGVPSKTANEVVNEFARHLVEDGKSPKTIESYVGDVIGFIRYLEDTGTEFQE